MLSLQSLPGEEAFQSAVRHHQDGRLGEAVTGYESAIQSDPAWPDPRFNLGLAFSQQGQLAAAATSFERTVELAARFPNAHYNLGLISWRLGRHEQAVLWYRKAIALRPDHLEALLNLGIAYRALGRLEDAASCYENALRHQPRSPEAQFNLGIVRLNQGRLEDAIVLYRAALDLRPDYWKATVNLGAALQAQGRTHEAVRLYRQALERQPDNAELHNNLGVALQHLEQLDEAAAHCQTSAKLKPDCPDAFYNLGVIYRAQGRLADCVTSYRCALDLKPDYPEAWSNLGVALQKQDRMDEAILCQRTALDLRPEYPEALSNLGVALYLQRRMPEASSCLRQALVLEPGFPEAHINLASVLMRQGRMAEGWAEYEWRFATPTPAASPAASPIEQPRWHGEAAAGRTILVHAEQGLGDTLQFCRYATLAEARGLRVVLEVQPPLVRLLRCLDVQVVAAGDERPPFDLHCPMLSLPLAVGTIAETIPSATPNGAPYLRADPAQAAEWAARLASLARPALRVGLVWAGSPSHKDDRERSVPPARLAPLFGLPGVHWFSLQKGGPTAPDGFPLIDPMAEMHDMADTAALVANLDLVVSVDSAVAHLGAALGRPVWMMDRFDPDWRWPLEHCHTPWYPTLRIYRQPRRGQWEPVIAAIVDGLIADRAALMR